MSPKVKTVYCGLEITVISALPTRQRNKVKRMLSEIFSQNDNAVLEDKDEGPDEIPKEILD